jgi:uncharacterized protein YndB with AHSA1/START domain
MDPITVIVTRSFNLPPEIIFDAWLDESSVGQWLFATPKAEMKRAELDPRVGGTFVISEKRGETLAEHFGTFEVIDRPGRLVFTFTTARDQRPTRVTVAILSEPDGCILTLQQSIDPAAAAMYNRVHQGWTMILDGLAKQKSV